MLERQNGIYSCEAYTQEEGPDPVQALWQSHSADRAQAR